MSIDDVRAAIDSVRVLAEIQAEIPTRFDPIGNRSDVEAVTAASPALLQQSEQSSFQGTSSADQNLLQSNEEISARISVEIKDEAESDLDLGILNLCINNNNFHYRNVCDTGILLEKKGVYLASFSSKNFEAVSRVI